MPAEVPRHPDVAGLSAEISILGEIAAATRDVRTSGDLAGRALDILVGATGATAALILFNAGEGYQVGAQRGLDPANAHFIAAFRRVGARLTTALEASDRPIAVAVDDAPFRPEIAAAIKRDGVNYVLLAGLRVPGSLTGVLALGWPAEPPRLPSEAIVLQAAALIGVSLENARLVESLERTLASERRMIEEQSALQSVTLIGETALEFSDLAETTVRQVVNLLGADAGAYALLEPHDRLFHVAHVGVDDAWIGNVRGVPASTMTPIQRFLAGSGPYLQPYAEGAAKPENLRRAQEAGHTAYASLPIRIGDRLEGLITVWFTRAVESIAWSDAAVGAISRIAGISLANFRLRERLVASETRYRILFEHSPDALLLLAPDTGLVAANRAARELYRTDFEGLRAHVANAPRPDEAERRRREALIRRDGRITFLDVGHRLDGSTFPAEVEIAPVEITGESRWLVLVRDLTERNRLQQELLQAQKMEAIGQLVSGVAHELNNPLASIVAFSQLIVGDGRLPADMRHDAELLVQEADRTRRIVQNLLDFARQRPPERHPTSIRPLVESVLALQSYSLSAARIEVGLDLPADLPLIDVDRSQLQQVLLNLILNAIQAIQAAHPDGHIWIAARRAGDGGRRVRLSVSDDGPGIAEEFRSRLFLPFFSTKEPGQGTGLGLSVSFGIVAAHNGSLSYEPRPGGGATFIVELPAGAGADERALSSGADPTDPPARAGAPPGRASSIRGRVLVLDDEPSIRAFLTKGLRLAGLEVVVVADGLTAIERCRAEDFEAVLIDHRMPGMSGTDVLDAIVAIRPEFARRFVVMSGDVLNPELRAFARERGVSLLAKPFDLETVNRLVSGIVAGTTPAGAAGPAGPVGPEGSGVQRG